jgi:hypothetical protein
MPKSPRNIIISLFMLASIIFMLLSSTSCNSGIIGGVGKGAGGGSGNVITLASATPTPGTVTPYTFGGTDPVEEFANGLFDGTNYFIVGNDFPTGAGANPNVYLFKFDTSLNNASSSPVTIDFNSGTNGQFGNLYIDQDTNNVYVEGGHLNSTDNDIFVAKINKSSLGLDNNFVDANPNTPNGVVLLDRGNSETPGGLLVDSTNNVLYVSGYNNQGKVIIFKLDTTNGSLVNTFGTNGYAEINADNNDTTQEMATDILFDGTNLIVVGEQQNSQTTNLMLFKVNPNTGALVNNSLLTIAPPSGETFVAAPLDAYTIGNKVYLGANLQPSGKSVLAVFDLSNNTTNYFTFKDSSNNDITIDIADINCSGTTLYLSGTYINSSNNSPAYIKFDTSNNTGSYYILNTNTDTRTWGNIVNGTTLLLLGGKNTTPGQFRIVPVNNP